MSQQSSHVAAEQVQSIPQLRVLLSLSHPHCVATCCIAPADSIAIPVPVLRHSPRAATACLCMPAMLSKCFGILLQTTTSNAQREKVVSGHVYNCTADLPTASMV